MFGHAARVDWGDLGVLFIILLSSKDGLLGEWIYILVFLFSFFFLFFFFFLFLLGCEKANMKRVYTVFFFSPCFSSGGRRGGRIKVIAVVSWAGAGRLRYIGVWVLFV